MPGTVFSTVFSTNFYWLFRSLIIWFATLLLLAACTSNVAREVPHAERDNNMLLITITEPSNAQRAMVSSFSRSYRKAGYPLALSVRHTLNQLGRDYQLRELDGWSINALGVYCALFALPVDLSREQIIQQLQRDSRVESVQALFYYSAQQNNYSKHRDDNQNTSNENNVSYNDPYFSVQYRDNTQQIHALHRWATGKNVTVAVIDTGIDIGHPELVEQIAGSRNFVDQDENQFISDIHGTAVAGIIAAAADNGEGIVGIAPEATLWAIKACWQLQAKSSEARCNSFTLTSALSFAIEQQLDIINISLSGPRDPLVARVIAAAIADGRIVVAADPQFGELRYPALLPGVIAVSQSSASADKATADDNRPRTNSSGETVSAAGTDVLSTGPGGGYDFFSGSSISTALVTGYTALLHQKNPNLTHQQRLRLLENVRMLNDINRPDKKAISLRKETTGTDL